MSRRNIVLPDLGFGDQPIVVSLWLVARGATVSRGDAVVEILCGSATVDLPSPADGILIERLATEDEAVVVGQCLGVVEEPTEASGGR